MTNWLKLHRFWQSITLWLLFAGPSLSATAADLSYLQPMPESQSEAALVNDFICNSNPISPPPVRSVQVKDSIVVARLLTPLNSQLNRCGDAVAAVVSEPVKGALESALPVGTLLRGCVEDSNANGRMRRDGLILLKFYVAESPGQKLELVLRPANNDGVIHPLRYSSPLTRKQILRNLLAASSHIAIPLAIGSGGLSIAITTGAGAVIGGALADNHQYLRGAARGAWEGSGLSIFDPIVCKGKQVILPWGTRLTLKLEEPVNFFRAATPTSAGYLAGRPGQPDKPLFSCRPRTLTGSKAILSTSAQVLDREHQTERSGASSEMAIDDSDPLAEVKEFIAQKNLASAMQALDQALAKHPNDPRVTAERDRLIPLVTGNNRN